MLALITASDLSKELSASANKDVMPTVWGPALPSQIAQGYSLVERIQPSPRDSFGRHDDTTKVMDA